MSDIYVMNKADLVMQKGELPKVDGDKIFMSALDGCGLQELLRMIKERVFSGNREGSFLIPYENGISYFPRAVLIPGGKGIPAVAVDL